MQEVSVAGSFVYQVLKFVFMPSSLPLLHTAMPTPCLKLFGIAIPGIFLEMFFCLVSVDLFVLLKTDNSAVNGGLG